MDELKPYFFDGDFNAENVKRFVENYEGQLLYFASEGGSWAWGEVAINHMKSFPEAEIRLFGPVISMALVFLLRINNPVTILDSCNWAMIHLLRTTVDSREILQQTPNISKLDIKTVEKWNAEFVKELESKGATDEEIFKLQAGEDVFFTRERLSTLLEPKSKIK